MIEHHKRPSRFWQHVLSLGVVAMGAMGVSLYVPEDSVASKTSPERLSIIEAKDHVPVGNPVEPASIHVAVTPPRLPSVVGQPFPSEKFSASNIAIKDHQTGAIIYEKEGYTPHPIASITKLMSALVLQDLNVIAVETTTVVADDVYDNHVLTGDTFTIDELFQTALIASSNKSMLSLVDASGLTREQFVSRMNEKAIELGLSHAVFVEPTGLDARNVASPSDVLLLLDAVMSNSYLARIIRQPEVHVTSAITGEELTMYSTNWLLTNWIPHHFTDYRGGKTGYIPASGYNVVQRVGSDDGHVLDIVVLGTNSNEARFTESRTAAEWAFVNVGW